MDSYLAIAERVLRSLRRPLSAREILASAFAQNLVPAQLHGTTQHKTLGARVSEDILLRQERSAFFRTEPGKFFLKEFLTDPDIPEKYKTPMIARRRERDLQRGRYLAISGSYIHRDTKYTSISNESVLRALKLHRFRYLEALSDRTDTDILLWSFVMVRRGTEVLTYRHGRYREGRDSFLQRRSVGFFTPVVDTDRDLFDRGDHGIVASGVRGVVLDLHLPRTVPREHEYQGAARLDDFILDDAGDLLAVVDFQCPAWFEPLTRRLAINELAWMRLDTPVNHLEDFDPWSQRVLTRSAHAGHGHA